MNNVAFIPARGGSKSIPYKNIKKIGGYPLIYWTILAACMCSEIDCVFLSTEDEIIKNAAEDLKNENSYIEEKLRVISRSEDSATDFASTEMAMLEFANNVFFDNIILIQATSPLLSAKDLSDGIRLFNTEGTDSVLSGVRQYRFLWEEDSTGIVNPNNYDIFHRPRRQDFEGYLMENGAFYITSRDALLKSKNRISGNIRMFVMDSVTATEIDEEDDWVIMEHLLNRRCDCTRGFVNTHNVITKNTINSLSISPDIISRLKKIKVVLSDCDGCLTDGGMYYSEKGDELKKFNTKDGQAFGLLKRYGYLTGVISGENLDLIQRRGKKLKLDYCYCGCNDKLSIALSICKENKLDISEVLYIGDDIIDVELLHQAGVSVCPRDANIAVKDIVDIRSHFCGGGGVVREIADMLITICKLQ